MDEMADKDVVGVTAAEFCMDVGWRVHVSVTPDIYTTEYRDAITGRLIGRRVGCMTVGTSRPKWRFYLGRKEGTDNG